VIFIQFLNNMFLRVTLCAGRTISASIVCSARAREMAPIERGWMVPSGERPVWGALSWRWRSDLTRCNTQHSSNHSNKRN
jgi:hypothetical protein